MNDDARPRFSLALAEGRGLARFASTYLVSVFLVLLGGWLTLYGDGGKPRSYELAHVLGTQLVYAACLALVIVLLARRADCRRDVVLLLPLLLLFLHDGLLVQHLYGWIEAEGVVAATVGAAVAVGLMLVVAKRLQLPWLSPLVATPILVALFVRLGPFLLTEVAEVPPLVPRQVALGWMLALCLLPCVVLRPASATISALPLRLLELGAVALSLGFALLHYIPSGNSFDLPFRLAYLAPLVVLAGPALDELFPHASRRAPWRLLSDCLPVTGAVLAAWHLTPGLALTDWTQSWPLTPFWFVLVFAALVEAGRALARREPGRLHLAAGLGALALLGGDLPEILVTSAYPHPWQALAVTATTLPLLLTLKRPREGLLLHALGAWVATGSLAGAGYPRILGWLVLLTWGAVLLDLMQARPGRRAARLAMALVLTALPVGFAVSSPWTIASVAVAVSSCVLAAIAGLAVRDPLLRVAGPACASAGLLALPLRLQVDVGVPPGILLVELGFVLLLVGAVSSLAGERFGRLLSGWWRSVELASAESEAAQ